MDNEYYYLNELEIHMEKFLDDENTDFDFCVIPPFLKRRMAEAAFSVLKNNAELYQHLKSEEIIPA